MKYIKRAITTTGNTYIDIRDISAITIPKRAEEAHEVNPYMVHMSSGTIFEAWGTERYPFTLIADWIDYTEGDEEE